MAKIYLEFFQCAMIGLSSNLFTQVFYLFSYSMSTQNGQTFKVLELWEDEKRKYKIIHTDIQ